MVKSRRVARIGGVVAACLASMGLGLALVFRFVTAETVSRMSTVELLGMIGLLVLPGLSAWAVHAERTARRARAEILAASSVETEFDPADIDEARSIEPGLMVQHAPATPDSSRRGSAERHRVVTHRVGKHARA